MLPYADARARVYSYVQAGTFDGNLTVHVRRWVFPEPDFEEVTSRALAILMELTFQGELNWVVFVPAGYRL